DDRGVHLLEGEAPRHLPEVVEEPGAQAHVLRVEVAGAARRLERGLGHGGDRYRKRPGCARAGGRRASYKTGFAREAAMTRRRPIPLLALGCALALACSAEEGGAPAARPAPAGTEAAAPAPPAAGAAPADLPRGLLVALSPFEVSPEGKVMPKPQPARLEILARRDGAWSVVRTIEDPDSNVFHKAFVYDPGVGGPGILTLGGTAAALKLWRPGEDGALVAETLWTKAFGGR